MSPIFWMILSSFLFALLSVFVKMLNTLPLSEVIFFRAFLNFLILSPWLLKNNPFQFKEDFKFVLLRSLSGLASMYLYFYAIDHLKLADAVMLNYSSPIPTLLLSAIFLGEKLSKKSLFFVGIAILGMALIVKPDMHYQSLAGVAGFISAFAAAIAYVSIRAASKTVPSVFIVMSFAGISSLISGVHMLSDFVMPTQNQWILIICMGSVATLAQISMTNAYAGLQASVVSPFSLSAPIFSAIFGYFLWKEVPDIWSLLGAALIWLGLFATHRTKAMQTK